MVWHGLSKPLSQRGGGHVWNGERQVKSFRVGNDFLDRPQPKLPPLVSQTKLVQLYGDDLNGVANIRDDVWDDLRPHLFYFFFEQADPRRS